MSRGPASPPIRVRMAPSPTGPLHIGTARTSLYNYLFARHVGGTYVLRIEDTDLARSTADYERDILDNLHWLGITWDEGPQGAGGDDIGPFGPYRQSLRMDRYAREADRLLQCGAAYHCWCTTEELDAVRREQEARKEAPRYNGRCLNLTDADRAAFEAEGRRPAVRFRVPPETIRFDDLIRGEVEFDNACSATSSSSGPMASRCTTSWSSSTTSRWRSATSSAARTTCPTPRSTSPSSGALGYREPVFGHIPLILNPDRSKMSKRKSQTAISDYRDQGYLPEAMVNFLAFLGWSPGTEEELFTLDELAERFEISEVHKAGPIFDRDRLDYLNGVYIRSLTDADLALRLRPFVPEAVDDATLAGLVPLLKERMVRLTDGAELSAFLAEPDEVVASWWAVEDLVPKGREASDVSAALGVARDALAECADWTSEPLESVARSAADALAWKAGDFFRPIRLAVTGKAVSPPLFGSMVLLGRERTLARLDAALERLRAAAQA